MAWTDGATELRFTIAGGELRIAQDGKDLGTAKLDGLSVGPLAEPAWGNGVYGVFTGTRVTGRLSGTE